MDKLTIRNNGANVVESNFWDSPYAVKGVVYLSLNAGAFRLLVPDSMRLEIPEMRVAEQVVVSVGPWPEMKRDRAIEVLFDDGSDSPFALHFGEEQIDRIPLQSDSGREFAFLIYSCGPKEEIRTKCGFRFVEKVPFLKPWRKS